MGKYIGTAKAEGIGTAGTTISWTGVVEGETYEWETTIVHNDSLQFYHDFNLLLITEGRLMNEMILYLQNISDASVNGLNLQAELWNLIANLKGSYGPIEFNFTEAVAECLLSCNGVAWENYNYIEILINLTNTDFLNIWAGHPPFTYGDYTSDDDDDDDDGTDGGMVIPGYDFLTLIGICAIAFWSIIFLSKNKRFHK